MRYYRGQRVKTASAIDYYPYTIVSKGSLGTVVSVTRSQAGEEILVNVALDDYHKGLAEWDNRMLLALDLLPCLRPLTRGKPPAVVKKAAKKKATRVTSRAPPATLRNHCRH